MSCRLRIVYHVYLQVKPPPFYSLYLPFNASFMLPVVCFDAKINFDDNAEFRQKDVFAMDDMSESDPVESEAAKWGLKYIGMDGNIACFGTDGGNSDSMGSDTCI